MNIWMDVAEEGVTPKRGDRVWSARAFYFVMRARKVRRRDATACPRFSLWVERADDIEWQLRERLYRSASRAGGSFLFRFSRYPRKKRVRLNNIHS